MSNRLQPADRLLNAPPDLPDAIIARLVEELRRAALGLPQGVTGSMRLAAHLVMAGEAQWSARSATAWTAPLLAREGLVRRPGS
jgi:hypothetical protein